MTAKEAIKARCLDCLAFKCGFDCVLFGLAKLKASVNRIEAIRFKRYFAAYLATNDI
jgi:hypothetical protein